MAPWKPYVEFHNGHKMPIIGLGTWQSKDDSAVEAIVGALDMGYRHIDTAYIYRNEETVGNAMTKWIQKGGGEREDLFIVTKLAPIGNRPDRVEHYLKKSLENLKTTYVDLYLIHNPCGMKDQGNDDVVPRTPDGTLDIDPETDLVALWKAMEAQVDAGRTKSIGISNFNEEQIERILKSCRIKPANHQASLLSPRVEVYLYFQQKPLREFCAKHGITICAYAPLGSPGRIEPFKMMSGLKDLSGENPLENEKVKEIARKHHVTPAQVLLRHLAQQGVAVIPKSTNPARIQLNYQVFNFELTEEEMQTLNAMDRGKEARNFKFYDIFNGIQNHPEFPFKDELPK